MRWIVAVALVLIVLVVFHDVPIVGAFDSMLLAIVSLLSAIGHLLARFMPSV